MDRWTLQFTAADGEPVEFFNLSEISCRQIEALQSQAGGRDFVRIDQGRALSQLEIDLIKIVNAQVFANRRQANDDASV